MSKAKAGLLTLLAVACVGVFPEPATAVSATTSTTLSIAPGNSVVAGTAVTLTATVTELIEGNSVPLAQGTVVFCNANAVHCEDSAIFGSAQLTSAGTATIKLTLGVGSYSITAAFQGTSSALASASGPQPLTVTANASYSSSTTITASGSAGNYTLTGTVTAAGKDVPTGTVSFLDTNNGNEVVGSAGLNPATLDFTLVAAPRSPVTAGQLPQSAVMGDFNNDGKLDLAITTASQGTTGEDYMVAILLGNGDGTFQPQVTYSTNATDTTAMAMGDFNGDGNIDLAFGNGFDATISILLGNGDGTFRSGQVYAAGNLPWSIAVADFNHDGYLDLAVLDRYDGDVSIFLGQGDGTFQIELQQCGTPPCPPLTFPVGDYPTQLATADFNGDGNPDLVAVNSGGNTFEGGLSILLGMGDGTFQGQLTTAFGGAFATVVADFNGDGIPDLAVVGEFDEFVSVLLGNGNGTFQPPANYIASNETDGIAAGDFQGTGQMDLVVANADTTVGLLLNNGNGTGTFQPEITFPAGNQPIVIAVGDLTGDGLPDLAVVDNNDYQAFASGTTILLAAQTETATAAGQAVYGTGFHNLVATYTGDTDRLASESSVLPLAAIPQTNTTTTLTAAPNPAIAGQAVMLTATVAPAPTGTAAGMLNFYSGTTLLGQTSLNSSGIANFATSSLPTGSSSLTAVYSGDTAFAASTSAALNVTVNAIQTTTTLNAVPNPAIAGQAVILTATVAPALTGTPAGTVNFYAGTTLLGTTVPNSSGIATFATTNLPAGLSSLTAVYSGNAEFAASTSIVVSETVTAAAITTNTALTASPNPVAFGQPLALTATVSPAPTGNPAGTVSFYSGATWLGAGALDGSGAATFTTTSLGAGSDSITAVYSGNAGFGPSTSSAAAETVTTDYTVTAPAAPITVAPGGSATVNITVPPLGGAFDSVVTLSTFGLPVGATASFNPPTVTPGSAGAQSVLTIQLATQAARIPAGEIPLRRRGFPSALFSLAISLTIILFGAGFGRKRLPRALVLTCVLIGAGVTTSLLTACGAGKSVTETPPAQTENNYTITVIGTSGSLQASTTVTLVVQ